MIGACYCTKNRISVDLMTIFLGWVLPYVGMLWRFCGDGPILDWILITYLNTIRVIPLSAETIILSLSCLVQEKLGPNVGLICHQNVLLTDYKHFLSMFSLIFNPIDPFSFISNIFDPSFLQDLRSDLVQNLFACWTQLPNISWNYSNKASHLHGNCISGGSCQCKVFF